ncbi:MAG: glycosyltransferase [Bradyrhizobium sp.]|nr:glycosyltransferase [Bradyrhizobium sp.]
MRPWKESNLHVQGTGARRNQQRADVMQGQSLTTVADYERLVGGKTVERILDKARRLGDLHVVNVSSTYYGGGVAEILSSLTLLMNSAGIKTGWRIIQGRPDFFSITKKMHNALQGDEINLTSLKMQIYEEVALENAVRNHFDHDLVIVHDPQPLPLIQHYRKKSPWVWRCHVDLTQPNAELWSYLSKLIERYDAVVLSLPAYAQNLGTPQRFIMPAINPFSSTNKDLTDKEIDERLSHYDIPTDLPIVVQVSRFDKWKDPEGVIRAFQIARKSVDCTLVLVGNIATDDPEGQDVFASLCRCADERIRILSVQDSALVNALQRRAAVVLQKSIREGFGLTVTEAMWKGAAVVGGRAGGITHQIEDGVNGFLVGSVEEAAERIVALLKDRTLASRLGEKARESVRNRFLMTRLMEEWLDLMGSFEPRFGLRGAAGSQN